jgi:hypothetical protein
LIARFVDGGVITEVTLDRVFTARRGRMFRAPQSNLPPNLKMSDASPVNPEGLDTGNHHCGGCMRLRRIHAKANAKSGRTTKYLRCGLYFGDYSADRR